MSEVIKLFYCLIVDDEPLARNVLEEYISLLPNIELVASCKKASDAIVVLQQKKIDLIFCDIKMPGINGLQFLKSLTQNPKIIITTAYREYAVDGFDIGVADYLLKPISIERFLLSVNRALYGDSINNKRADEQDYFFFKTGNVTERVYLNHIDYIIAYGNYSKIHFADSNRFIAVNYKISELEAILKSSNFTRVHKSYVVNQKHVSKLSSTNVTVTSIDVPLGESYKKTVFEIFNNR